MNSWHDPDSAEYFILDRLLTVYERQLFSGNGINLKFLRIDASSTEVRRFKTGGWLTRTVEFNEAAENLAKDGYVTQELEKANVFTRDIRYIYLNADRADEIYELLGRKRRTDIVEEFCSLIKSSPVGNADIDSCLEELSAKAVRTGNIPSPFSKEDNELNRDIIRTLNALISLGKETFVRDFSTTVFLDSKYFERTVRSKVLSILKKVMPDTEEDDIFKSFGLVKYPETIYFKGPLKTDSIVFPPMKYRSSLDSEYVDSLVMAATQAKRVITIENKAAYFDYAKTSTPEELVIYTGGFPSPSVMHLLELVGKSGVTFLHWSDIDYGGFNIFNCIQKRVEQLVPFRMDADTLKSNKEVAMPLKSEDYRQSLERLLDDDRFSVFYNVITYMLDHNIKLEQEALYRG